MNLENRLVRHDIEVSKVYYNNRLDNYDEKLKASRTHNHHRRMSIARHVRERKIFQENERIQKLAETMQHYEECCETSIEKSKRLEVKFYGHCSPLNFFRTF